VMGPTVWNSAEQQLFLPLFMTFIFSQYCTQRIIDVLYKSIHYISDSDVTKALLYQAKCRPSTNVVRVGAHRRSLQGGVGAKPPNADAHAIFSC